MLKTNGDFVATIRNDLKALNKDDYISARYILSVAYGYTEYIINNRALFRLYRDARIFNLCSCIELKRVKSYECEIGEFQTCKKIMKSLKKLPDIMVGKNGFIVEYVLSVDNGTEYEPLRNAADFGNQKLRQFGNHFKYYYIDSNNYIYLLNTTTEAVNVSAAFLGECAECGKDCDECKSKLEEKFIIPQEYLSIVSEQTLNRIMNGNKKIITDENPNLDSTEKGRIQ